MCIGHRQSHQPAGVAGALGLSDMPQYQEFRLRLHRGQDWADAAFPAHVAAKAMAIVIAESG